MKKGKCKLWVHKLMNVAIFVWGHVRLHRLSHIQHFIDGYGLSDKILYEYLLKIRTFLGHSTSCKNSWL